MTFDPEQRPVLDGAEEKNEEDFSDRYPTEADRAAVAAMRTSQDCLCHVSFGRPGCFKGHGYCPFLSSGPGGKELWRRRMAAQMRRWRKAGLYWKPLVGWKVRSEDD
jgi:hypothetical protein